MATSRLLQTRPRVVLLAVLGAALGVSLVLARGAHADFPLTLQGDAGDNVVTLSLSDDGSAIHTCVDGFCGDEAVTDVDSIDVDLLDGNDTLVVDDSNGLVTNAAGTLRVFVHGGPGTDVVQVCPDTCTSAPTTTTTYDPAAGTLRQEAADGSALLVTVDDVQRVEDRSPGFTTVLGTAAPDAITVSDGPAAGIARVSVGALPPLDVSDTGGALTIDAGAGDDVVELASHRAPTGFASDCGDPAAVCVIGGSGSDRLVLDSAPAATDAVALTPLAAGTGRVTGLSGLPSLAYAGVDAVTTHLSPSDHDTLRVTGTSGDDAFRVTTSTTPGSLGLTGDLATSGASSFAMPPVTLDTGNGAGPADLTVAGGGGSDRLSWTGTPDADMLTVATGASADTLTHVVDGQTASVVHAAGLGAYDVHGGDGADLLTVPGTEAVPVTFDGGVGPDRARLAGSGPALTASFADGSLRQAGGAAVTTSDVESLAADAAGGSVSVLGTAGDDALTVTPTDALAATVARAGDARTVQVDGVGGVVTVEPGSGRDTTDLRGTDGDDQWAVSRAPAGTLAAQLGSTVPLRTGATTESVVVDGLRGADRFLLTGSGGPASLTLDGGADGVRDTLDVTEPGPDATVTLGSDPASGTLGAPGSVVSWTGIDAIAETSGGAGGGTLTAAGSNGDDSLSQSGNVVSLGGATTVTFGGFGRLALAGGPGSDAIVVDPRSMPARTSLAVDGGTPGATPDTLSVLGSNGADALTYRPTGPSAGEVDVTGAPATLFTGIGAVVADGRTSAPAADTLTVDTSTVHGAQSLTPGPSYDSGTFTFVDGARSATTAPPLSYGHLGTGSLAVTDSSGRVDQLTALGTTASDVLRVGSDGTVTVNGQLPVRTPGVAAVTLRGLDGADSFALPAQQPFPGATAGAPGILLDGGSAASGDTATVDASAVATTVDYGTRQVRGQGSSPVGLTAVNTLALTAPTDLTVLGTDDPDVMRYSPTGKQAGTITRDTDDLLVRFTGATGPLRVDPAGGSDRVVVNGTSGSDAVSVAKGDPTVARVGSLPAVQTPASTESLQVLGGDGDDTFAVTGSGGPATLTLDGGPTTGTDTLSLSSATVTVAYGNTPDTGTLATPEGTIGWTGLDVLSLTGTGAGSATVRGSGNPDTITLGAGGVPGVQVGNGAVVRPSGYPALTVDAGAGDDTVTVPTDGLGDVSSLTVLGGGGLGDRLVVTDAQGRAGRFHVTPAAADEGTLTEDGVATSLQWLSTEALTLDGAGGGDELDLLSPSGQQTVHATPAPADDAGTLQVGATTPVAFQRLGSGGLVRLLDAGGGRADLLAADGTAGNDSFAVDGSSGQVRLGSRLPVAADGVDSVTMSGFDGEDTFALTGPLPFTSVQADGGGSSGGGDRLTAVGPAGNVVTAIGDRRITGYGGTVTFPGVESVTTDLGGRALTELGTTHDDAICYDPASPRSGSVFLSGAPGAGTSSGTCTQDPRAVDVLHSFTDVGALTIDPAAGSDQVIVDGTTSSDLVVVDLASPLTTVAVNPTPSDATQARLTAGIVDATTESILVASDVGADSFDVHPHDNAAPRVTIDGEEPTAKNGGDWFYMHDALKAAHLHTVTSHTPGSGTTTATFKDGVVQTVDYVSIENLKTLSGTN